MVFYLKYRPKTLSELDNSRVATLIGKYLTRSDIPHAFLFTGSRGTGKTSTARIIAKSLNCVVSKIKGEACGKCDTCLSIGRGDNLDVLEIDAASNRGIDEIRDLREKIKLAPIALKYKVYIIDEVHMLTTEAFNALLKTLEEPPQHAVFILATTEAHKIPETILSRCVRIDFGKATPEDLLHSLKRIVAGEKLKANDQVLQEIIEAADGSFRDATKMLEELSVTEEKMTQENARAHVGGVEQMLIHNFLEKLRLKQVKDLLEQIQYLETNGKNIRQFFISVLKELEKELIAQVTGEKSQWQKQDLLQAAGLFSRAFAELKTAVIPALPFELAVVEYCEGQISTPAVTVKPSATVVPATMFQEAGVPKWPEILEQLKSYNHSLVGVLRSCRPLEVKDNVLVVETPYKFHADRLADPKTQETLAKVVRDVLGQNVTIEVQLKKRS